LGRWREHMYESYMSTRVRVTNLPTRVRVVPIQSQIHTYVSNNIARTGKATTMCRPIDRSWPSGPSRPVHVQPWSKPAAARKHARLALIKVYLRRRAPSSLPSYYSKSLSVTVPSLPNNATPTDQFYKIYLRTHSTQGRIENVIRFSRPRIKPQPISWEHVPP
jgi:hypothetical protein